MTYSLPLKATLGAHVLPALAHDPSAGSASLPVWDQCTPSVEVDSWMLMVWLGEAKFCVENA